MSIVWLAIISLAFYAWWDVRFVSLLAGSICFNYLIGRQLSSTKHDFAVRKYILVFGIAVNLVLLGYYKYFNFFLININYLFNVSLPLGDIILPLGISFFTFTQIAFLVDVYRKTSVEYRFMAYVLFVTFFPHLIAGPILHHQEMMPQFEDRNNIMVDWKNITIGTVVFILGLFKKVIIADSLAIIATQVFNAAAQGGAPNLFEAWAGALAYSLQLYFDFSGYSDMAVGLALLFNIRLPINFFSPYKAKSVIDFWRRWHMTLSRYLKDYLYIPLGGNRHGEYKRMRNLLITMLLGGLWHGAGWTFVIWGGLHGIYLVINHTWRRFRITLPNSFAWLITFVSVVTAWVFFRSDNVYTALSIVKGMLGLNGMFGELHFNSIMPLTNLSVSKTVSLIGCTLAVVKLFPNVMEMTAKYRPALGVQENSVETIGIRYFEWRPSFPWILALGIAAIVSILSMVQTSEFLYFQF